MSEEETKTKEEETSSNEEEKTEEVEKTEKTEEKKEEKVETEEKTEEKTEKKAEEKPTKEEKKEEVEEEEEVEIPEKFKDIVEKIEEMSVLELNELVKVFEKKFGVSAAAAAAPVAGGGAEGGEEEKSLFNVELTSFGDQKIAVIKVIKEILGLGLKEAKEFVEGAPQNIKEGVNKEDAEEIKGKIEEAGGQAELK